MNDRTSALLLSGVCAALLLSACADGSDESRTRVLNTPAPGADSAPAASPVTPNPSGELPPPAMIPDGLSITPGWQERFNTPKKSKNDVLIPENWEVRGKPFTAKAVFDLYPRVDQKGYVMRMFADKATASNCIDLKGLDLNRYPVMRFCWRVKTLPTQADGRIADKDDQAIGVYVGSGGMFSQESVAYRWETLTPKGENGKAAYGGGSVKVKWFALRNESDPMDTWQVETVNVRDDYKAAYGSVPKEVGLSISCNSQYTQSKAEAELAWVMFLTEADADALRKKADVKGDSAPVKADNPGGAAQS